MQEYYQVPQPTRHPLLRAALLLFFKICYFYRAEGTQNVPRQGPFLIASNHQSFLDPLLVGLALREPLCYMAWAALFRGPRWFARLIHKFGAFPVDLDRNDPTSYRLALDVLKHGEPLVIFPEAGRQDEGRLMELRPGAARLAMHAQAPIVPVRIEGAWAAWPKPRKWPYLFKPIKVTFGEPIPVPERRLKPEEREAASREIMERLRAFMSGEAQAALPAPVPAAATNPAERGD